MFERVKRVRVETDEMRSQDALLELTLSSADRDGSSPSCADANFSFSPPISGVVTSELGWLSFYNVFPNVVASTNTLGFNPTVGASVDVVFEAGFWRAPAGLLTLAAFLTDPDAGLGDVRYEIYRQVQAVNAGLVESILISPVTAKMTIAFAAGAGSVVQTISTNSNSWTGFLGAESGSTWSAPLRIQLIEPVAMAIQCNSFSNSQVRKSNDTKSIGWMTTIPITSQFGDLQYYEPNSASAFSFVDNRQVIGNLNVKLLDAETGLPLPFESDDKWTLMLRLRVSRNL